MPSNLLANLQELITKRVAATFFPALALWFANALMLYAVNAPFRLIARTTLTQPLGTSTALTAAALIGVAMSSYVLSGVLPAIRSLMEGNWRSWFVSLFAPAQTSDFERLERELAANNRLR